MRDIDRLLVIWTLWSAFLAATVGIVLWAD